MKKLIFLLSVLLVLNNIPIAYAENFENLRIEQEDKLFVPLENADEVWNYLYQQYVADKDNIKKLDPLFSSYYNEEDFTDVYFDTPDLKLLSMRSSVRHRKRINLTNPEDIKNEKELIQIKVSNISSNPLNRGEFKFPVDSAYRKKFEQKLGEMGINPASLRPILTVKDLRERIYFEKDGKPIFSISFDNVTSRIWWARTNFIEIEPELNEITYTEANSETRKNMEGILGKVVSDIKNKFPFIKSDLAPKYNKSFNYLNSQLPFLKFLVKFNLHHTQGILIIIFILLIIIGAGIYWLFAAFRRKKINKQIYDRKSNQN